jgi:hypothetical protein
MGTVFLATSGQESASARTDSVPSDQSEKRTGMNIGIPSPTPPSYVARKFCISFESRKMAGRNITIIAISKMSLFIELRM